MPTPLWFVARVATAGLVLATALPIGAQDTLPRGTRDSVIAGVLDELDRAYVFPEKATAMRRAIDQRRDAGEYDRVTTRAEFAAVLTRDLQAVSHDKHLRVRVGGAGAPPGPAGGPRPPAPSSAIGTAEVFAGNVGYVEIRSFGWQPDELAEAVGAAMTKVADTDALIIDVRQNGGGSPDAVRLVSSYLFGEEPVHLNSLYFRPANSTQHFYTMRAVAGKRFGASKPVFVLTSRRTFSAAEEFAYNLQSLKRATIVGDTTGGGAHPGGTRNVAGGFSVFVPSGRAINPVTGTNWEGTGVLPTIAVPSDSALAVALGQARRKRAM